MIVSGSGGNYSSNGGGGAGGLEVLLQWVLVEMVVRADKSLTFGAIKYIWRSRSGFSLWMVGGGGGGSNSTNECSL